MAAYLGIKHFHHWILGYQFTLYTDHKALIGALQKPLDRPNPQEVRRLAFIGQYSPRVVHISGAKNVVADTLSRCDEDLDVKDERRTVNALSFQPPISHIDLVTAQAADEQLDQLLKIPESTPLKLALIGGMYSDTSTNKPRPYIPSPLRRVIFDNLHRLYHPGLKQTQLMIGERFIWPGMKKDVAQWARECVECQRAKVTRHNQATVQAIPNDVDKFSTVHIDLVGPLPPNKGCRYLLTMIDRFTRWPEVIPISDMSAETVANAFLLHWVARYGVPDTIVTDRGAHFESILFNKLLNTLVCKRHHTTAYHPQSNGLIERFHRTLKNSLRTFQSEVWIDKLPMILLGLRNAHKEELGCSASQALYGHPLSLPLDLLEPRQDVSRLDVGSYTENLQAAMQKLLPACTRTLPNHPGRLDKRLKVCQYVFVRNNARRGLKPNYNGPYKVVNRGDKTFQVQYHKGIETVSVDRLKAKHLNVLLVIEDALLPIKMLYVKILFFYTYTTEELYMYAHIPLNRTK